MKTMPALLAISIAVGPVAGQTQLISVRDQTGSRADRFLQWPARLDVEGLSLAQALVELQRTSGVPVAFSTNVLPTREVECHCADLSVEEALARLVRGTGLRFGVLDQHVVVEPRPTRFLGQAASAPQLASPLTPIRSTTNSGSDLVTAAPIQRTGTITGVVIDASTRGPVAAADVYVPGATEGTLTNAAGRFLILNVPAGPTTVRAERIGYEGAEQLVEVVDGEAVTVTFELEVTGIALDDVVVSVEAGEMRRMETGTDIGSVNVSRAIQQGAVTSMSSLLQSRAPGLSVTLGSGQAGAGSRIRVRGPSSLTQDNNPLLIIDGVRVSNNTTYETSATSGGGTSRLNDINPHEIEDIQVVKGPAATALYGSEAGAGVIIITTKRGTPGRPSFTLSTTAGTMSNPWDYPDNYADVTEFYGITDVNDPRLAQFRAEANPVTGQVFLKFNPFRNPGTTPFESDVYTYSTNISVNGGSDDVQYFASAGFDHQDGIVSASYYDRVNLRTNVDFEMRENLRASFGFGLTNSGRGWALDNSTAGGMGVGGFLGSPVGAYGNDPTLGPGKGVCARDVLQGLPDGTTDFCTDREGNFGQSFEQIMHGDRGEDVHRSILNASLTWMPRNWFVNRINVGSDRVERDRRSQIPLDPRYNLFGSNSYTRVTSELVTVDYTGTIERPLTEDLDGWTTFGGQWFSTRLRSLGCSGEDYANDLVTSCNAGFNNDGSNDQTEQRELGAFLQQRVGFREYLYLTGALRVDDNASLGVETGAIWSPSFNVSAVVSEMPFWNVGWVNDLRVRAAWGTASQSPAPYSADQSYFSSPVVVGGETIGGIEPGNPGNPDLGPERSTEIELGLDAGFLDNRMELSLTHFRTNIRDLIVSKPVAPSTGFSQSQLVNLGEMESKGYELTLSATPIQEDNLTWDVRFTHSTYDPVITDLGLDAPIFFPLGADGGSRAAGSQVFQTGVAPGAYVSPVVVNAVRDQNGNITSFDLAPGTLGDGSDLRVVGSPWPGAEQSFFTSVSFFRDWIVSALVDRVADVDVLNVTRAFRTPFSDSNLGTDAYSREYAFRQVESTPEQQAMIEQSYFGGFLEDGSYVKLREVSLRYALPLSVASRVGAASASLTFAGRNLKTWSDFSILDPEMDVQGSRDNFIRNNFAGSFPPLRTWWLGVNLTF